MGSILGIKYKNSTFKQITNAWDSATDSVGSAAKSVTKTVVNAWDSATDSVGSTAKSVTDGVTNGFNSVVKTVENVGTLGLSTVKKYWYIPVIAVSGLVAFKMIGTQNTVKLLNSLRSAA